MDEQHRPRTKCTKTSIQPANTVGALGSDPGTAVEVDNLVRIVKHFHRFMHVSPTVEFDTELDDLMVLEYTALQLKHMAKFFEDEIQGDGQKHNSRYLRAHLLLEELAETLQAFASGDKIALLDGLSDLLYVLLGVAATYDLRLGEAFERVCRSNMTKQPRDPDADDPRLRTKGSSFQPPYFGDLV